MHTGKQNHRCKAWGRQFVLHAEKHVIAEEQRILVARFKAAPDHLHIQFFGSPSDRIVQQL